VQQFRHPEVLVAEIRQPDGLVSAALLGQPGVQSLLHVDLVVRRPCALNHGKACGTRAKVVTENPRDGGVIGTGSVDRAA